MTRAAPEATTAPPTSIAILGLASFIISANTRTGDLLLPVIADDFGTTVGRAALVTSSYALSYGFCQLLYGPLGDRVGKLRVMVGALFVFALATVACALAPTLPALVALRLFSGGTAAALIPLAMGYIADHVPYGQRQATLARFLLALSLGQVLGASLSGILSQRLGWRGVFVAYGAAALLACAAMLARTGPARAAEAARGAAGGSGRSQLSPAAYWRILRRPLAPVVIGGVFLEGMFLFSGIAYFGAALRARTGLPFTQIGLILGCLGIGGLVYSAVAGPLIRTLGERGLILTGGGLALVCFLALAPAGDWWLFVPFMGLLGLAYNMLHATMQTKATELAPNARGTAIALFAFALFMGQGVGAALLGALVDRRGFGAVFALSGVATALLALGLAWLFDRHARAQTATAEALAD